LTIVKTATPDTYDAVGDVISYSYLVTNAGTVTLSGPFTVSDDQATDENCPATATLAPGDSITCTASYTITQADLDAGSVTNVASATNGTVTSPTDTQTVTAVQGLALTLVKTATPSTYDAVGDVISYSYLVTNAGTVTLSGPFTVSDDKATDESCPVTATLAPGASITCTASYTIIQADLDAGSVTNLAYASNGTVTSPTDSERVTVGAVQTPTLTAEKSSDLADDADGNGVLSAGDALRYTITITNAGAAAATGTVFSDVPDTNTVLVAGSVTTTQGTIVAGNVPGDTWVQVDLGTLPGGGTAATITFEVQLPSPMAPGVTAVANQGTVTASNHPDVLTDDPDTTPDDDPTEDVLAQETQPIPVMSPPGLILTILLLLGLGTLMLRRLERGGLLASSGAGPRRAGTRRRQ
jgi:uncharacterized repeat protein (TIGR01451 family)